MPYSNRISTCYPGFKNNKLECRWKRSGFMLNKQVFRSQRKTDFKRPNGVVGNRNFKRLLLTPATSQCLPFLICYRWPNMLGRIFHTKRRRSQDIAWLWTNYTCYKISNFLKARSWLYCHLYKVVTNPWAARWRKAGFSGSSGSRRKVLRAAYWRLLRTADWRATEMY
jgi:hypothetical protein